MEVIIELKKAHEMRYNFVYNVVCGNLICVWSERLVNNVLVNKCINYNARLWCEKKLRKRPQQKIIFMIFFARMYLIIYSVRICFYK